MKVRRAIRVIGIGLAALIAVLAVWPVMNVAGFCWAEKRFLSDAEFISAAIEGTYRNYPLRDYSSTGDGVRTPVVYGSLDDFVSANKGCCKFVSETDHQYSLFWFHRIQGLAAALVEIKYRVEADRNAGAALRMPPGFDLRYHVVTNCGRAWNGI
jgi:hypothetical protein